MNMAVSISPENEGLKNLTDLVNQVRHGNYPIDKTVPIVLVSGFSGWGEALFGTFNYWGGFEDLPAALHAAGYTVIVVPIGPLSTNWERACEVYAQLISEEFYEPGETESIPINYGTEFADSRLYEQQPRTKPRVQFGSLPAGWKWSASNPLHFICHSQGGNTIRMLIELMNGTHAEMHPSYFPAGDRQDWIKSVVTLGTPHKGTTIIDVVQGLLPEDALDLITRLVVSVSFHQPGRRFYDLQLDHWGFARLNGESFSEMHSRLLPVVERWWQGIPGSPPRNGFYDNSIRGVAALNRFAPNSSQHTFYFTMSFDATVPFPNESLTSEDLAAFPLKFPLNIVPDPFNFFSGIGAAGAGWISKVPGFPNNVSLAGWAVQVANNHLGPLGYFNKIPSPGPRIPRSDMLPFLSVFAYAMGGLETQMAPNITADELQHNDGIVNTASMRGPNGAEVSEVHRFPIRAFESVEMADLARGVYWHMGINKTMDHADEIGVFTVGQTYQEVKHMYELFAELLSQLP